ncbi:DUF3800 domain-containing protein [Ralstonia solanacearum]|uniref:DUF3800 domain-containing protein n=1 Tax=Ralstonia solanacearum TaxID=305 RepID=UPI001FF8C325|nr:DUF3800 domain-containing protein [Ralstonia solanacearum]MDB0527607.1 DUF3800 domain-containing protein [Ralstonia solanacearum]MDB0567732.1 DUF3800 domain-containing protein [Ralstonia solanacearum]MDB0577940.1 DUF3800 domain-containing protein [Ralstonia solanacearum]
MPEADIFASLPAEQDEGVDAAAPPEGEEALAKKLAKVEKEKAALLKSLAAGDFSTTRTRVAFILNLYKDTRNSDVTLAIKYWEQFQPELYSVHGILPQNLFKLERFHLIVRARAKIQNEYGLYLADDAIRRHRRRNEEAMEADVVADAASRGVVQVFADETGKTQRFVTVAAIWVLAGRAVYEVTQAVRAWQKTSVWANREIHFAKLGARDADVLQELLNVVVNHRAFLSFKVISYEREGSRRSVEDIVARLHEFMLVRGLEHEVGSARVGLPLAVTVTLDEEPSLDEIARSDLKAAVERRYDEVFEGKASVESVISVRSHDSVLVQLADLIAGAVNRRLNHVAERGVKDDMADAIVDAFGLVDREEDIGLDAFARLHV